MVSKQWFEFCGGTKFRLFLPPFYLKRYHILPLFNLNLTPAWSEFRTKVWKPRFTETPRWMGPHWVGPDWRSLENKSILAPYSRTLGSQDLGITWPPKHLRSNQTTLAAGKKQLMNKVATVVKEHTCLVTFFATCVGNIPATPTTHVRGRRTLTAHTPQISGVKISRPKFWVRSSRTL